MHHTLESIIEKVKAKGTRVVDHTYLTDKSWFFVSDDSTKDKIVFIFRSKGVLLISRNGDIAKATWEIIDHAAYSLMIERQDQISLFNIVLLTKDFLLLQKDGTEVMEFFVKQDRYNDIRKHVKNSADMDYLSAVKEWYNAANQVRIPIQTTAVKEIEESATEKEPVVNVTHNQDKTAAPKILNNEFIILKNPLIWYIDVCIREDLSSVELMSLKKFQNTLRVGDILVKSKATKRLFQISSEEWKEKSAKDDYLIIFDTSELR